MEKLINAVFPPRCVFCGALGDVFCENCMSNCTLLKEQRCLVCDRPSKNGETHPYHYVLEPSQKNEETRLNKTSKGTVQFLNGVNASQLENCRSELVAWDYSN